MKTKVLVIVVVLTCMSIFPPSSFAYYQEITYEWTKRIGGPGGDYERAIATDPAGNIYVTGDFWAMVDFGADFGTNDIKTPAGMCDIYVTRINSDGTYGWTKRMGEPGNDSGYAIAADPAGNVYVTGYFQGILDFGADFGTTDSKISKGLLNIFVTKINSDGSYGWTRRMGGPGGDSGIGIVTDSAGNVYVTGGFNETVDFGEDFGTNDIKTSAGGHDIYVTRINSDSTYGWTRRMGGLSYDDGIAIATDSAGNVYVTGYFRGIVDFGADFGTNDIKTSAGHRDIYVTRINSDSTYGWTRRMGGSNWDNGNAIAIDSAGNVYVTGRFDQTVDFGADFGTTDSKTSIGMSEIFITRINSDDTYGWTKRMGGTGYDSGNGIATDSAGNVYVTGGFDETVDFGADFGTTDSKTSAGYRDIFVTKLEPYIISVAVDIKPGSCPNPLNTKSKGVLPVAILGTEDFDVTTIDPESIQLEGVSPLRWAYEDVATPFEGELCECHDLDGDGYLDLTLKFNTQEIVAALGIVNDGDVIELAITGNLREEEGGTPISGQDCVEILLK